MRFFDEIAERADALKQVGPQALLEARQANIPVYYMQPEYGDDIIREYPDGHRERISNSNGGTVLAVPPRA